MELDQLKNIWQKEQSPRKEDKQMLSLLGKRSNNPIARMKRNLFSELIAIIILYGSMIVYYAYAFHGTMSEVSWFLVAIAVFFIIYYYRKNKLLNEMECVACHVKSNLQRQVRTLEKYVQFYLIAGTALGPLTILFFGWVFYIKLPKKTPSVFYPAPGTYPWWESGLAWVGLLVVCTILVYYLNVWYVRKLYGKHVQKLKELLAEMDEG
jgi:4-hydroxybenzoate polyprenyltransferase